MHAFRSSCLLFFTFSHKMRSCVFSFLLMLTYFSASAHAARFDITNRCTYTVWAAAVPGGGRKLNSGESWTLDVNADTKGARIWARTGCNFDGAGRGSCQTGDCGGILQCQGFGQPPNTLAEYALNQFQNIDFFDISLVEGFNVPMVFSPTSNCDRGITCKANINGECPDVLRAPGGCNNPCTVFETDEYCCNSGTCEPTDYSRFFKQRCLDAYSYSKDDQTSTFTCPGGTDYQVVFCPGTQAYRGLKATINITNKCSFVVWAAAVPGGGRKLNPGQSWALGVKSDTEGRIWARTGCEFNSEGQGRCDSGDCSGVLECRGHGRAPHTLAEYALKKDSYLDMAKISLVEGFNVPVEFSSASAASCDPGVKCTADINGLCPMELRDPGGCNNPCTVFNNDQFCCKSDKCTATSYSKFFKGLCPDVYTYPLDHDSRSTFSCLNGTDYNVVFCP